MPTRKKSRARGETLARLSAPWTLHFDRECYEDSGVVYDAAGCYLFWSRTFWMPKDGDPVPDTLAALWLVVAAPRLLDALKGVLNDRGSRIRPRHRRALAAAVADATGKGTRPAPALPPNATTPRRADRLPDHPGPCRVPVEPGEGRADGEGAGPEPDWGVCPRCGGNDGYLNLGREHWFVCHEHALRWLHGENLFPSWCQETFVDWQANWQAIGRYEELAPCG